MTVKDDILLFLRDPAAFAAGVPAETSRLWDEALKLVHAHLAQGGRQNLREAQFRAFRETSGQRVVLVLGPPGTGKTHLLGWMAAGLLGASERKGCTCRILVSGFTRVAIVNLMEKVLECTTSLNGHAAPMAFLGRSRPGEMNAAIPQYPVGRRDCGYACRFLGQSLAVAGMTTWALSSLLKYGGFDEGDGITSPLFDLVLIDEASQMVVSQGLMALAGLATDGRVIAAGDDKQLPPVQATFHSNESRALGSSLYSFLKSGQVREFLLDETFRLNAPLADYPRVHTYDHQYRSAVPDRRLHLNGGWADGLADWERAILNPEYPICVLLHDGPLAGVDNSFERSIIRHLVELLLPRLVPAKGTTRLDADTLWGQRLAVITPHRVQNAALRKELAGLPDCNQALVDTVDRIQGRERDMIIAGYTVADEEFALAEADFLFSPERLNVTVTRARNKLILLVSRRLLEVIPPEEEVFDAADRLRDFVFECQFVAQIELPGENRKSHAVEIRVRQFDETLELPTFTGTEPGVAMPAMTAELEKLLDAIREIAAHNNFHNAASFNVDRKLRRTVAMSDYLALARIGWIQGDSRNSDHGQFFSWTPLAEQQTPFAAEIDAARLATPGICAQLRRDPQPAIYSHVRSWFLWFDETGADVFREIAQQLVQEGICRLEVRGNKEHFDLAEVYDAIPADVLEEPDDLHDEDWAVLNCLEDLEQQLINFGQYETFVSVDKLSTILGRELPDVGRAVRRLEANCLLIGLGDEIIRSRMSELAREVRYVKQRFQANDADRRPFVARAVRVAVVDRQKPARDGRLGSTLDTLGHQLDGIPNARESMGFLRPMLNLCWGTDDPGLAHFQLRGLEKILPAYLAVDRKDSFVITADTGSGKTEAACLPMILGAACDRLAGRRGVKFILVYPRIRLVFNQAQRLVRYLAALAKVPGAPTLSLGLQTGAVPTCFAGELKLPWVKSPNGAFVFPFFKCPRQECGANLELLPGQGDSGLDRLQCNRCGWSFAGFAGSKRGLHEHPPDLFISVTESLHQWLQSPVAGRLFGDDPNFASPRGVLVDEIHLYSHIHGAQVGYALRRLLARAHLNARQHDHQAPRPLAIGMSATLGRPDQVWGELLGREVVEEIKVEPHERDSNPKGREYFYFVQTEIESRGQDIAGASTTIQSLMCLAHGMRRRRGKAGGFRGIVFFDSIDNLKRLHQDYRNAEQLKRLARLRTISFPNDPVRQQPRLRCCGQPRECDVFRSGECWYFAAQQADAHTSVPNDPYQVAAAGRYHPGQALAVMKTAVHSGATGRIEEEISQSDLIFSTSSLEVGFDDPDMILVYQHYAPANLASFIQRKGRGGRGSDDRPVTGITLSVYSPRDTWYFRHTHQMLEPSSFELPLNMENFFVRRGQAIATILDLVAREQFRAGNKLPPARGGAAAAMRKIVARATEQALPLLCESFGENVLESLGVSSVLELWDRGWNARSSVQMEARTWRELIPWVPNRLFDSINLPLLSITYPDEQGQERTRAEDVTIAFSRTVPANATRQFTAESVLWIPPGTKPSGQIYQTEIYAQCALEDVLTPMERDGTGNTSRGLSAAVCNKLDDLARARFNGRLVQHKLCRPQTLLLVELGRFVQGQWRSNYYWDRQKKKLVKLTPDQAANQGHVVPVHHRTSSTPLGTPLVAAKHGLATAVPVRGLPKLALDLWAFRGGVDAQTETGLQVSMAYWGVDIDLRLDCTPRESITWTRVFGHPQHDDVQLHGYSLATEGVQLTPNQALLNEFVAQQMARLTVDPVRNRGLHAQFFRFLLAIGFASRGLSNYAAGPLAELIVASRSDPELFRRLNEERQNFDPGRFSQLLTDIYQQQLACHPLLTSDRLQGFADLVLGPAFGEVLQQAISEAGEAEKFSGFLRSGVLYGLALALHRSFVVHGRGDERQVHLHAQTPVQFSRSAHDTLTVFEAGDYGDGTTRTFLEHIDEAFSEWHRGELADCPHAAEDALIDLLFADSTMHNAWRQQDPDHPATLDCIVRKITGTAAVSPQHKQVLRRVLFESELVGIKRFYRYDLIGEVRAIEVQVQQHLNREPSAWELVSAAVSMARKRNTDFPNLLALYVAYEQLQGVSHAERLDAAGRLAEQVYRLGARLCVDGCRACVHQGSTMMSEEHAGYVVSRRVLADYREVILTDLTITVDLPEQLPNSTRLTELIVKYGTCRLLINARLYDALSAVIGQLGFCTGVYDPLLKKVVAFADNTSPR